VPAFWQWFDVGSAEQLAMAKSIDAVAIFQRVYAACPNDPKVLLLDVRPHKVSNACLLACRSIWGAKSCGGRMACDAHCITQST
jgi:hypothetical protein